VPNIKAAIEISSIEMKLLVVATALILTGCVSPRQTVMPLNVAMLPADCGNRQIMLDWLEDQARQPQQRGESAEDFQRSRRAVRRKIWDIRYHCQSV